MVYSKGNHVSYIQKQQKNVLIEKGEKQMKKTNNQSKNKQFIARIVSCHQTFHKDSKRWTSLSCPWSAASSPPWREYSCLQSNELLIQSTHTRILHKIQIHWGRNLKAESLSHTLQVQSLYIKDILQSMRGIRHNIRAVGLSSRLVEVVVLGDQLCQLLL